MGKRKKWESAYLNNAVYLNWYNLLKNIAVNRFKYSGIPETIDSRFLEMELCETGWICYFRDDIIGDLVLPCTLASGFNVYGIPKRYDIYSNYNGYHTFRTIKNSVIIFNNYTHTPTEPIIRDFARRFYEIDRAIDVNVKAQKTPIALLSSEKQRLTMKNLYMQYDGNEPFIFGDKDLLNLNDIKSINTNAPYVSDKMTILKHQLLNEFLSIMGIENSNEDKRERLVADEVGSNYGLVEMQRNVSLNARKQAFEKINAMFNMNITVSFNTNLQTMINGYESGAHENE